jgi:hypothetical protein
VAPNITPDMETGIGSWTDEQFDNAVRKGIGRSGEPLYPAMPYNAYTKLTREDVVAIRAYLNTVTAVYNPVVANTLPFPFNIRTAMRVWDLFGWRRFDRDLAGPRPLACWARVNRRPGSHSACGLHCRCRSSLRSRWVGRSFDFLDSMLDAWVRRQALPGFPTTHLSPQGQSSSPSGSDGRRTRRNGCGFSQGTMVLLGGNAPQINSDA